MDKKTPLYDKHLELGATMKPFAGYIMPIRYTKVRQEHMAVRSSVGLFDLSHMGEFRVKGPGSMSFLDYILTNDADVEDGQAFYSAMCYPDGGIVDDLVSYRLSRDEYLLVVNASNIDKDWAWISSHAKMADADITNESASTALVAVQGPLSQDVLSDLTDYDLDSIGFYHHATTQVAGNEVLISRTGYTGEDGFEIYVDRELAAGVWDAVSEAGEKHGMVPVGLGARDTLRLEVGYLLYGNDIDHTTSPVEARISWAVKLKTDKDFIGREVLVRQKADKPSRYLVGMEMDGKGIPREHYDIYKGDIKIGHTTSGTLSPALEKGVALGYVERGYHKSGSSLEVEIRGRMVPGEIVKLPFYKDGSRR